jgi:hypothetical protein
MYALPQSFDNLIADLIVDAGSKQNARTLAYVELTLFLARRLGLEAEPVTIGWVLLSKLSLHHILLNKLTSEQRRMQANAAIIVPLSSRFAWENALVQYEKEINADVCLYRINDPLRLDEQMIDVCRQQPCPDPLREERYEAILSEHLPFTKRPQRHTAAGETYRVHIKTASGIRSGRVKILPEIQADISEWFDTPRPRTVITLELRELLPTAQFLDAYERRTNGREHWVHDLQQIRFRKALIIDNHISLEPENTHPLHLEGAVHLPGMVSAGKTTLAKLIIAHCIHLNLEVRITLVVGDSQTALSIAHQVNSWFYDDPAGDGVIAVPILGATQRETHLRRLLESREYQHCLETGRPHWGERWLMPVCPLAAKIKWEGEQDVIIPAGHEPCTGLIQDIQDRRQKGKRHLCPLFSRCPSKQTYRDMPRAQLWVITPGALSQAALPLHLDSRIAKMGDLVYEQSDLVIFDEVETIVDWFDRTFAQTLDLTNGKNGLLDRLDTQNSLAWSANRVMPTNQRRWVMAMRDSLKALTGVLTAIANPDQERVVKKWIGYRHFAPNHLAYRLARRLAGLKEWDDADTPTDIRQENEKKTKDTFAPFDKLLNQTPDPLRLQIPPSPGEVNQVGELARLMQSINNLADDGADADIFTQSRDWILRHYPDIEDRLAALRQQLEQSDDKFDQQYLENQIDRSVDELAQRLQFMLTVALLDRHMHIVVQEWHNKPDNLDAEQPFSRIPRGMRHILPLPLTGQQYGFICDTSRHSPEAANRLSMFMYTNIGRSYILNFHRLREDFDGLPGPNVLALSGTSWLPDSTPFHVPLPPAGVLMSPKQTEVALQASRFYWQPFADERNRPLQISGKPNKERQLRLLMKAMLDYSGLPGGFIGKELTWLEAQARDHPTQWADRVRILMLTNSYPQSKAAAKTLRSLWPDATGAIFDLKQGVGGEDYEMEFEQQGTLRRIDIEQFAANKQARILIAPMQSIGRGFNILNNEARAAFGSIFFLTRPMNQPHDVLASAQELNRYALQWAEDPLFPAWAEDTLYKRAIRARENAVELRRLIEHRYAYSKLMDDAELGVYPRRDLAASTAGRIVQAVGRLLRGGVPFRAYFVDAAWSPQLAQSGDLHASEPEETSLLTAVINIMSDYADHDAIGQQLYGGLSEALITTRNRDSN